MTEKSKSSAEIEDIYVQFKDSDLGEQISSSLYKLEHISDHHVKERRHHFRMTNIFVGIMTGLILMIAGLNLYNLYYFYGDTMVIIDSVNGLDSTVVDISKNMENVALTMKKINVHMAYMDAMYSDIGSMSKTMPLMQQNMFSVGYNMGELNNTMGAINGDMEVIDHHVKNMSSHVGNMRHNVHQMARPMGKFNQFFPD